MATKTSALLALNLLLAACPGHTSGSVSDRDQTVAPPADLTDSNAENSSGEALCSSQTCPGCCLSSGECVTTTTNTICGQGGASCVDCTTFGTTCIAGTCQGCVASCEAKPCGSSDGCGGVCQAGSGCIPPCTPVCTGKTCGSSDGCGDTCKTGSGCVPPCTPACTGKTCGVPDGCGGTCKAGSGCVAACIPDCNVSCGASDGCGGTCTGDNNDSCKGIRDETWRCVYCPRLKVKVSQVCRSDKWVNFNTKPRNCSKCCVYSPNGIPTPCKQ